MYLHWVEILKFIKNNLLKIILGAIVGAVIITFISSFNNNINDEGSEVSTDLTSNIEQETTSKPASFYFFVENNEGISFSNGLIIEQFLLSPEELEKATEITNIDVIDIIQKTNNEVKVNYTVTGLAKVIRVARDESSNLMELSVNLGDNNQNLALARYYHTLIESNEIPFFTDKDVYIFTDPTMKNLENVFDISPEESPEVESNEKSNLFNIIIGAIVGGVLSVLILIVWTFFSKKLIYSFSYFIKEKDIFYLVDDLTKENEKVLELLEYPNDFKKIVVCEKHCDNYPFTNTKDATRVDSLLKVNNLKEVDRLIFIIEENSTSRKWYNEQRQIDKYFENQTYVVQINS